VGRRSGGNVNSSGGYCAIHAGMRVIGISVVTNLSNIFHSEAHTQEEIRANASGAKKNLEKLVLELIKKI